MEHRPLSLAARLILLCLAAAPAWAADGGPSPEQQADWQQRLDQAEALVSDAKARQAEADRIFKEKETACFKRFLVNSCRDEARKEHIATTRVAKRIENEGKALERTVKKEQRDDKERRRLEAEPERAAELDQRKAQTEAERQAFEADLAKTQADKAAKAEAGAKRKAAEAEKQRKKREEHDARVAAKMLEAEKRAAGAEKK